MLGEYLNWLGQALMRLVRRTIWPSRHKPSLTVAIGKRRKANALEEYRRRFELMGERGLLKPPAAPDSGHVEEPQRFEAAKLQDRIDARGQYRQDVRVRRKTRLSRGAGHFFGAAWTLLTLALLRSRHGMTGRRLRWNGVIAVIFGCTIALGGAFVYRMMRDDGNDSFRIDQAAQSMETNAAKPEGGPSGRKLTYARLTPEGPAAELPPALSTNAASPKPADTGPDNRTDPAPAETTQARNPSASSQTPAAGGEAANKPTMVRSETYLPDGTRVDVARPAPVPSIVRLGTAKPRPPFLAAAQPPEAAALPAVAEKEAAPAPISVKAAEPAPSLETGYFAQVKADQDQKAADAELSAISEKYKAVLGEVPLKTRSADLKEKGVWIRVLAGPLKSRDDAVNLCKKLRNAGIEACIVQKID
jgi:hypothetical protein